MAHERLRYCAGKACDCHAKAPLGFGVNDAATIERKR